MGLTDPCSSYSFVLLNAAVVSENSSSRRSWLWRIAFSSAARSWGCRFVFGRWRKRSMAASSSATKEPVARVGSASTTILYQSTEHMFVCQLLSLTLAPPDPPPPRKRGRNRSGRRGGKFGRLGRWGLSAEERDKAREQQRHRPEA